MSTAPTEGQKPEEIIEVAPEPAVDQQQEFAPPPAPPAQEAEADKESNRVHMSPADEKRQELYKRFKRDGENRDVPYHGDHADPTQMYGAVAAPEPEPEAPAEPAPAPVEPRKFKVKVRHEERELTEQELIAHAQKAIAAETYLDDARKIYEDARRPASSRPHQDEERPAPAAMEQDDPAEPQHPEADPLEELVETLQYGDKKDAAEKLRTTLAKMSEEQSERALWSRRINDDIIRDAKTVQEFADKNPDLAKDDDAVAGIRRRVTEGFRADLVKLGIPEARIPKEPEQLAQHHRAYKLQGQPVRQISEILTSARDDWMKKFRPSTQPSPQPSQNGAQRPAVHVDRTERRAAIPQQPSRATVPPSMQPSQPQAGQRDLSATVAAMRRARGQPTA